MKVKELFALSKTVADRLADRYVQQGAYTQMLVQEFSGVDISPMEIRGNSIYLPVIPNYTNERGDFFICFYPIYKTNSDKEPKQIDYVELLFNEMDEIADLELTDFAREYPIYFAEYERKELENQCERLIEEILTYYDRIAELFHKITKFKKEKGIHQEVDIKKIKTPRFFCVRIEEVFENKSSAIKAGYWEPTHYHSEFFEVLGRHVGPNTMIFAAVKKHQKYCKADQSDQ